LIGNMAGTYQISELIAYQETILADPLYPLALGLILLGAFTKSAQFPFHFWLPGAMKAPTPVSAYLHSATMVKAGVYILARFFPILGATALWSNTLMIVGGFTMLYAAVQSLFRLDLKAILAYMTIGALGMLMLLFDFRSLESLLAAIVFVFRHALNTASLFTVTCNIELVTGTTPIPRLSGLPT